MPYIVRVDSGTINRAIYQIAMLDDPDGWNRKFVVSFGGSSGTQYIQGVMAPPPGGGVLNHQALSKGFGYLISSELVNGRRGNGVLQGETLMMIKEYIIERYGVPKFFIGSGGSGGAIQQLVITQMYPGLLDGLMPSLTFPDSSLHTIDSILLTNLWPKLDKNVWTPGQDHGGRRLHARNGAGVERRLRTARRADQCGRLRAGRQDADLRPDHQSQGRALHHAGHSRQLLWPRSEDRLGAAPHR